VLTASIIIAEYDNLNSIFFAYQLMFISKGLLLLGFCSGSTTVLEKGTTENFSPSWLLLSSW